MTSRINISLPEVVGKGYGRFWSFTGRYRVVKGSRASKKSKTTALNIIYRMMAMPEANTLVVRQVFNTLKDSCWADLRWATYRLGVGHLWSFTRSPLSAEYKPTGQQILFRGMDEPDRLASITVPVGFLCWVWIEEAYEVADMESFDKLDDTIRGELPAGYYPQLTLTFNPWSASTWIKGRFFDVPESDDILAMTTTFRCNEWLSDADRKRFAEMQENNPTRFRVAGDGEWGIDGEAVFEEWVDDPLHYKDRTHTHVIEPFEVPKDWKIYRGFDFGYARPFAVGWYAIDHDDRMYHILELYGCTSQPNTGVKWSPDQIFDEIKRVESEHRWLKGRHIYGIADPSIWDASRGESIAEMGESRGVYFEPGDNKRIPGWMQGHYRLRFDEHGIPMFYCFSTCRSFIRTVPALKYDAVKPEDVDSDMEDHIADAWRYVMMARPMNPPLPVKPERKAWNPLDDDDTRYSHYDYYINT